MSQAASGEWGRPRTVALAAALACALAACTPAPGAPSAPGADAEPTWTPAPIATLPPPVATPQPDLRGQLWIDLGFGEIWRLDLPSGAFSRAATTADAFPTQPSVPASGTPLAYAGAERLGDGTSGRFGIYIEDRLVLAPDESYSYQDPAWSAEPDALFVTRVGVAATDPVTQTSALVIQRLPVSGIGASTVVSDAFQPAASSDGRWLAYTRVDLTAPLSPTRSIRALSLGGAESIDREVVPGDRFYDVYGPKWLMDNASLCFAAAEAAPAAAVKRERVTDWLPALLDIVLGHRAAHAHAWSGHIWRVNADGSGLTRLTEAPLLAPVCAPSPDGAHIAVLSMDGIWVMDNDGRNPIRVSAAGGNGGIVWSQ